MREFERAGGRAYCAAFGGAHDLWALPSWHGGAAAHDARFDLRMREVARVETDYARRGDPADGCGRGVRNRKSMSGNVRAQHHPTY